MKKSLLMLRLHSLILLGFLFISPHIFSQSKTITGLVKDIDGNPLSGVTVAVKKSKNATSTGNDGTYSISIPGDNAVLVFSSVSFEPQEIQVNGKSKLSPVMKILATSESDVVVIGYSQQTKTKNSASVSKLDIKELANAPNVQVVQGIQGKIAGVSIPIATGQPGAAVNNIIIRGGTKVNVYGQNAGFGGGVVTNTDNSNPLVVIDGVFRSLNDVNPEDIESFQVMKDAASVAIYGARGANGVIVIKTKGGKFNTKPTITFGYRHNFETQARNYKYLNARDYLTLSRKVINIMPDTANRPGLTGGLPKEQTLNQGILSASTTTFTQKGQFASSLYLNALYDNIVAIEGQAYVDNLLKNGWETIDDPVKPGTKILFKDNHLQDILWNTAQTNNYNFSVNGGTEKMAYNVSAGYIDQGGVYLGTDYKRFNALGNFSFKVTDNFKLDASFNYQFNKQAYVDNSVNTLTRATRLTPLIRVYNEDTRLPVLGENTNTRIRTHEMMYDDRRVTTERFVPRLGADITIIEGLHYRPSVSLLVENYRQLFFRKSFPGTIQFAIPRQKYEGLNEYKQLMTDHILQYDHTFLAKHNISLLAGFNYTRNTTYSLNMGSSRGNNDYIYTINESPTRVENGVLQSNVVEFNSGLFEDRSASIFGQFSYDYEGKYLMGASLRRDGFSNFAAENKFATFPALSLGWNVHKEKFWRWDIISLLKFRGSYGIAGTRDLNLTDTYGSYVGTSYGLSSGVLRGNLPNPNLKWEQTVSTDIAVDLGLFQNRITLTVDWYKKLTKDRLASKVLPSEAPFGTILYNNGSLSNNGIEIELGATIIDNGKFSWRTNFAFAYNKQRIETLPFNGRNKNRQGGSVNYDPNSKSEQEIGGLAEGERPFGIWAFKVEKIFATDAEAMAWDVLDKAAPPSRTALGVKRGGDAKWVDINGDKVIDTRDMVLMGYRTPDKIGGMQNTLSYKGITMRVAVDFAMGHVISDGNLARSLGQGRSGNEGAPDIALGDEIWQKQGDEGKKYARFSFADYDHGQRNHIRLANLLGANDVGTGFTYGTDVSTYFEKGDFLAFREISFSYEIPKSISNRIKANGLSVYAGVYNLGYLTKFKGLNPETYKGFDEGGYPRPRQFSFGATLKL